MALEGRTSEYNLHMFATRHIGCPPHPPSLSITSPSLKCTHTPTSAEVDDAIMGSLELRQYTNMTDAICIHGFPVNRRRWARAVSIIKKGVGKLVQRLGSDIEHVAMVIDEPANRTCGGLGLV
jgi:hypothetical protein